jgi:small subunit ribosomal protein S3
VSAGGVRRRPEGEQTAPAAAATPAEADTETADVVADENRPIVQVDPELERLLAEEEDIERRTRGDHHETPHFPKDL